MHLGNVRTALFNWLFARNQGGKFILRIEDTDLKRHVGDAIVAITDGLTWLGMDWDEGPGVNGEFGPYFQSERLDLYRDAARTLMDKGAAYACSCFKEDRDIEHCTCAEHHDTHSIAEDVAVRFKNTGGQVSFSDIVAGDLTIDVEQFGDFILIKSDGTPTYNFANVIDDHLMEITHVIRGDDHLSNTPRQIVLYEQFGYVPPHFAHVPQILGPDGSRMSKRHGAVSLDDYRQQGFLPEGMMNYLALLGWSPDGENEFMTPDELIKAFELDRVGQSPGQFNMDKLVHLNSLHMEKRSLSERSSIALRSLEKTDLLGGREPDPATREKVEDIVDALGSRFRYGAQIIEFGGHFFTENVDIDEELFSYLESSSVRDALSRTATRLEKADSWDEDTIESIVRSTATEYGLKAAPLIHGIRVSLSGTTIGPSLFTLVRLVGQDKAPRRLRRALQLVPGQE